MYANEVHRKKLTCTFDGMCQPVNPGGVACYGFTILEKKINKIYRIYEEGGIAFKPFSKESSNNVAEYVALIKLLEWLLAKGYNKFSVLIQGDSQLIINQLSGKYKVKSEKLKIYYEKTKILIKKFENIHIEWISRENNNEADALANKAYIDFIDNNSARLQNKLKPYFATDQQINLLKYLKIKPSKYLSRIEANRYLKKYNKK
ncbi:MAG TPA: ribonuclease HI [Nitrososphaeraceae archaeon]|nr:ribonuclease HI [Nitrososphaeraceae archaeon]